MKNLWIKYKEFTRKHLYKTLLVEYNKRFPLEAQPGSCFVRYRELLFRYDSRTQELTISRLTKIGKVDFTTLGPIPEQLGVQAISSSVNTAMHLYVENAISKLDIIILAFAFVVVSNFISLLIGPSLFSIISAAFHALIWAWIFWYTLRFPYKRIIGDLQSMAFAKALTDTLNEAGKSLNQKHLMDLMLNPLFNLKQGMA